MGILVTGSSGMLGQALCNELSGKPASPAGRHEVIGIDINKIQNSKLKIKNFCRLDLTDRDLTIKKIRDVSPDIIIHCAAYTDVDGCEKNKKKAYKLNVEAAENVAVAASKLGSFLIYISTDFVFNGKKGTPYTEKDRPNPISVYGKTKLEAEIAIKNSVSQYLIIRTSWLFGKGGENFVDTIIEKAKKEKELKVVNDQTGSPTYTLDLAKAIAWIINGKRFPVNSNILHITNSDSCSWYEFTKEIVNLSGIKNADIVPISSEELARPAKRPKMSILDNTKFNKIYGRNLPNWEDALNRYLQEGE
jgi:dTDP-4-dehydrorhamnose reductase